MGSGNVAPWQRKQEAAIARYMAANFAEVSYAIGTIARYGAPVFPQSDSVNQKWNVLALVRFMAWAKRCDWSGRFDLWELQRIASQLIDTDGECAFWLRNDGIDYKIDLVESWQIYTPDENGSDNLCIDGVQLSADGRIKGYWVEDCGTPRLIDASSIKILSHPTRYSAFRAESPMRQGINDMRDHHDVMAFLKRATKLDAHIAGIIKRGLDEDGVSGAWKDNDATTTEQKASGVSQKNLIEGELPSIEHDEDFIQLRSDRPGLQVMQFLDKLSGNLVSSLQIPPAFFLDDRLTGPNQRSVNAKAQRRFDERQDLFCDLLDFLWPRIQAGLKEPAESLPDGWDRIAYQCPAKHTIDAGRETAQERADVQSLLMTRRQSFANRGLSFEHENSECFREIRSIIDEASSVAKEKGLTIQEVLALAGMNLSKVAPAASSSQPQSEPAPIEEKQ